MKFYLNLDFTVSVFSSFGYSIYNILCFTLISRVIFCILQVSIVDQQKFHFDKVLLKSNQFDFVSCLKCNLRRIMKTNHI